MKKTFFNLFPRKLGSIGLLAGLIGSSLLINQFNFNPVKASPSLLEFRWDNTGAYKKLYYWQSSRRKRDRATYYFVIKPTDRKTAILKLSITIPQYFDAKINTNKLSICKVSPGGMLSRTRCKENVPAVFEVEKSQTRIDIYPKQPIPVGDSYAVVMKIFNPDQTGMFQFNALAQAPGDIPISGYIGSWNIDIE